MRIQPELSEVVIVMLGSLNPRIFTPDWFARHGLFPEKEAERAIIDVVHAQITSFRTEWLSIQVQQGRFQASTTTAPYVKLSDLVVRTFKEFLPHTPLAKLGINRHVHFDVGSFETRDRIGEMLAPKEPWGDWAPDLSADDERIRGGMATLTMVQKKVEDRARGFIQATVRPSPAIGRGQTGIYMHVNDHYEVEEPDKVTGSDEIVATLMERFDASIRRSEWIIDQIMKLKQ
jgi:hypothetical protein